MNPHKTESLLRSIPQRIFHLKNPITKILLFFFEKYSTEVALYRSIQIIMNYFILIFLFYIFIYHKNPEKPKVNIQRIQIQNFWEVGYYTSQGMLIKSPNCVWDVEEGLS